MACPTCGFDPPTVSPSDAVVAARSFPRRYRAVLLSLEEDEAPTEARQAVLDHADAAADALRRAAEGVGRRSVHAGSSGGSGDEVLARLEAAATALADAVGRVPSEEWERPGLLDAAREGVHQAVHHLRSAKRVS